MKKLIFKKFTTAGLNAQAHGFPKIFNNQNSKFVQIMWLLFTLISAIACFYFLIRTIQNYLQYPTITNFDIVRKNSMLFPTVTICDGNAKNDSLDKRIFGCRFDYALNCLSNITIFYNQWLPSYCYQFNSINETFPFMSSRAGEYNGLELKLFQNLMNYTSQIISSLYYSTGLLVYIHEKNSFPGRDNPILVKPGEFILISMRKTILSKLNEPYNNCIDNVQSYHSFDSKYYKKLTSANYTYRQKDCIDCGYYHEIGCFEACESPNFLCKNVEQVNDLWFNQFYLNKTFEKYLSYCPLECSSTTYTFSTSHGSYPSSIEYTNLIKNKSFISILPNGNTTTIDDMKKYVSYLNIYYEELEYSYISQQPKMEIWDLVSSVGGLFGLFLGVSFLSFIDIIQILIDIIFIFAFEN